MSLTARYLATFAAKLAAADVDFREAVAAMLRAARGGDAGPGPGSSSSSVQELDLGDDGEPHLWC